MYSKIVKVKINIPFFQFFIFTEWINARYTVRFTGSFYKKIPQNSIHYIIVIFWQINSPKYIFYGF